MEMEWVAQPGTAAPDADKPFVALAQPGGQPQWMELATDAEDGVTPADLDFQAGAEWAATQQGPQ